MRDRESLKPDVKKKGLEANDNKQSRQKIRARKGKVHQNATGNGGSSTTKETNASRNRESVIWFVQETCTSLEYRAPRPFHHRSSYKVSTECASHIDWEPLIHKRVAGSSWNRKYTKICERRRVADLDVFCRIFLDWRIVVCSTIETLRNWWKECV